MQSFRSRLVEVEKTLGTSFRNRLFLLRALTHSSYVHEHPEHPTEDYEQFEFFGDALLQLSATEYLMDRFPMASEKLLTDCRSALVRNTTLAIIAEELSLHQHALFGRGQIKSFQMTQGVSVRVKACLLEAVIAAIRFDQGLEATHAWIKRVLLSRTDQILSEDFIPCEILRHTAWKRFGVYPDYKEKPIQPASTVKIAHVTYMVGSLRLATASGENPLKARSMAALRSLELIKGLRADRRAEILDLTGVDPDSQIPHRR